MKTLPAIEKADGRWRLMVDGKETLLYAGELHNSSSSSLEYMEQWVWPYLKPLHMNAVVAPIYWELFEPKPGEYDFTLVRGLIEGARREGLKLIPLWFGLWKNGNSAYVPDWVKTDRQTYFFVQTDAGEPIYTISPFCEAGVAADARAFSALLRMIREFDAEEQTVLFLQVENEIGVLHAPRDFSPAANAALAKQIPESIARCYGKCPEDTWTEAFGAEAGEYLMEYAYASAIERIAGAGQREYALPMYVNAWLEQFPWRPGSYPCGGPIARFLPLWQAVAPSIVALAPDVYVSNFADVCAQYTAHDNPLLVPEHRRDLRHMSDAIYAMGVGALLFAPFGIEELCLPPEAIEAADPALMRVLNIASECNNPEGSADYLSRAYALLASMEPILQARRPAGGVRAFLRRSEHESGVELPLTRYNLRVTFKDRFEQCAQAAGIVVEVSENEFYLAGNCFDYQFLPKIDDPSHVACVRVEEGSFVDGAWRRGRVLNGDETGLWRLLTKPAVQRVVLSRY